jgi:large subunit ribosomal protein L17
MRHLKSGRKLNRTASHRKALFINLALSLVEHERITTTLPKALELRGVVERLITYGKKGDLHGIRLISRSIKNKDIVMKIVKDLAVQYKDRSGGYTRVLKTGPRRSDNAEMAIIEFVDRVKKESAEAVS